MISAAVIFAEASRADGVKQPGVSPLRRLGGLTLLERAILTAERAGARTCYVVGIPEALDASSSIRHTPRCRVVFLKDVSEVSSARGTTGSVLVFSVDVVLSVALIQALSECLTRTDVPAVRVPGVPLAVVNASGLAPELWDRWRNLAEDSGSLAFLPDGYFVRRLEPTVSTAEVEKELVASLANPQDGFLDRRVNRPLSRWLTRHLAALPLRANHVTLLSTLAGFVAALCFAAGGYLLPVLGAFVLQGAAVLDCCDGELARLRFEESRLGYWLDIVGDTLVHIATFAGIAWGVAATEGGKLPVVLGAVLAAGVLPSFALVTYAERTTGVHEAGNHWEGRAIARMLVILTNRDFSVLILLFALLDTLRWFLWSAALGVHVFWLTLLWLLWRGSKKGTSHEHRTEKEETYAEKSTR